MRKPHRMDKPRKKTAARASKASQVLTVRKLLALVERAEDAARRAAHAKEAAQLIEQVSRLEHGRTVVRPAPVPAPPAWRPPTTIWGRLLWLFFGDE
jgi:hypothetical protein